VEGVPHDDIADHSSGAAVRAAGTRKHHGPGPDLREERRGTCSGRGEPDPDRPGDNRMAGHLPPEVPPQKVGQTCQFGWVGRDDEQIGRGCLR
jgi:hypothetical protein